MDRSVVRRVVLSCVLTVFWGLAQGQAVPEVPFDIEFAGVTVHVNEQARQQVQREVDQLYANRTELLRDIEALRQLTPQLEVRLTDDRLPIDFRYVALPFSNQPDYGYWGLTIQEASKLKLRVDNSIDERFHALLATDAVSTRLGELQEQSGNYAQTLVQYLQGVSPTERRPASKYATYLLLTERNPALLWKVLARKLAFEREEPVFRPARIFILFDYPDGSGQTLAGLAKQLSLTEERFSPFNQWLKVPTIPAGKRYPVLIRVTTEEFPVVKNQAEERNRRTDPRAPDTGFPTLVKLPQKPVSLYAPAVYYTINGLPGVQAQSCDNVITLAYYGDISIKSFVEYNDLTEQDVIRPGQIYYLARKANRAKVPFHVIQRGQTLRDVSNIYGVRLASLLRFNRVAANQRVQTGRIIWLQKKRPASRPPEYQQMPASPDTSTPELTQTENTAPTAPATILTAPTNSQVSPDTVAALDRADSVGTSEPDSNALPDTSWTEPVENLKLHIVKPGQSYYSIARQYGVTVKQLYAWNNLSERFPLAAGQELIVDVTRPKIKLSPDRTKTVAKPVARPKPAPVVTIPKAPVKAPVSADKPAPAQARPAVTAALGGGSIEPTPGSYYHVVQPGQTVYRIALINKVSVDELVRWNNLKNFTIEVGQRLLIRKLK